MMFDSIDDLEDTLKDFLPANFSISKSSVGELIIHTRLVEEKGGILLDMDEEDDEDDFLLEDEEDFEEFDDDLDGDAGD